MDVCDDEEGRAGVVVGRERRAVREVAPAVLSSLVRPPFDACIPEIAELMMDDLFGESASAKEAKEVRADKYVCMERPTVAVVAAAGAAAGAALERRVCFRLFACMRVFFVRVVSFLDWFRFFGDRTSLCFGFWFLCRRGSFYIFFSF